MHTNTQRHDGGDPVPPALVTAGAGWNDQLLYFTSSSLTEDDRRLMFLSDRTGHPNLFVRDLTNGQERQVSDNRQGQLKSYVYFDGQPYRGFGKASVSLDARHDRAYWIEGRSILTARVTGDGDIRTLGELPVDQVTAFTHVSADGQRLCVPTTDARALADDLIAAGSLNTTIDRRVQAEGLKSYLRVYDTRTGELVACEPVPTAWVTHVQFHPTDASQILYNHEWPADCGVRRMWLWDGRRHVRLRDERERRSRHDWVCHEMWERPGGGDVGLLYHGAFAQGGPAFIGRVGADGRNHTELPLPDSWHRYGHFTPGPDHLLVTDGYYQQPDDERPPGWGGQWLAIVRTDWASGRLAWQPLCRHRSSWQTQDEHPHPIFDHAGHTIYFTSDRNGHRAIYRVPIH